MSEPPARAPLNADGMAPVANAPDWIAIRYESENNIGTEKQIQERHGVTKGVFDYRKRQEGWMRRRAPSGVSRASIIRRLFHVLNAQISTLEQNMDKAGPSEAAVLGSLTTTLGKLMEFDKPRRPRRPPPSWAIEELRAQIAARIEQLNQG